MTREELDGTLLSWKPELVFAAQNGYQMLIKINVLDYHIYWNVKWYQDGVAHYEEFNCFVDARDYFLERINNVEIS